MKEFNQEVKRGFELREKDGVQYFVIPSFVEAGLKKHCFTTRIGGVSKGCYATLNLSRTREASPVNKEKNNRNVCSVLDVPYESLTLVHYAHGDGVYAAHEKDAGKGISREELLPECDALMTNVPQVTAVTLHADCVPLFFADPVKKAVCVAHAGWRGVYYEILVNIINGMRREYGSDPKDILVGIGPHIMRCCFKVQDDVAEPFAQKFGDSVVVCNGLNKYVDLQSALMAQLKKCGVLAKNVTCADLCTSCREDLFYSHRRDHGNTGAMGSFISVCDWN
ncbi:MAG: peptidoglycan editing factor PgeF [Christensenella sp.]|nr:peptidoglycan editing factor PgeF [Christensenella sp.]